MTRAACGRRQRADGASRPGSAGAHAARAAARPTGPPTDAQARAAGITDWQLRHREIVRSPRDTYLPRAHALQSAPEGRRGPAGRPADGRGQPCDGRCALGSRGAAGAGRPAGPPDRAARHSRPTPGRPTGPPSPRSRRGDVQRRLGVPVTSPGRTWLDLAAVGAASGAARGRPISCCVAGTPRRLSCASWTELAGVRGVAAARRVAPVADGRPGRPWSRCCAGCSRRRRLPAPVLQHRVTAPAEQLPGGRSTWRGRTPRVLVEFDGDVHRERRVFVE